MSSVRGLYTPEILATAMDLTTYPWNETFILKGRARSRSCGSAIEIGIEIDHQGRVSAIGLRPHACAVGQAAASIFAKNVVGLDCNDLRRVRQALALWLAGEGDKPAWPEIDLLDPARAYPARHGAILLAWDAALDAMDK